VQKLERLIYEAALEAAPDEASRESLSAGPLEQSEPQTRQPVLIAPRSTREKITLTPHAEQSPTRAQRWDNREKPIIIHSVLNRLGRYGEISTGGSLLAKRSAISSPVTAPSVIPRC